MIKTRNCGGICGGVCGDGHVGTTLEQCRRPSMAGSLRTPQPTMVEWTIDAWRTAAALREAVEDTNFHLLKCTDLGKLNPFQDGSFAADLSTESIPYRPMRHIPTPALDHAGSSIRMHTNLHGMHHVVVRSGIKWYTCSVMGGAFGATGYQASPRPMSV